jgi:hypothetical protein
MDPNMPEFKVKSLEKIGCQTIKSQPKLAPMGLKIK